jgi:AcrR family transcriptional regulator
MADVTTDLAGGAAQAKPSEKIDGRHERVERGKHAVFEAVAELFGEGRYYPLVADVAARAGVSERTLFRYFGSFNEVIAGMIANLYPRLEKYFTASPPPGDLPSRLLALAELRVEFTETHGAVTRTTEALAHQWPAAAAARYGRIELLNQQLREWIGDDMTQVSDEKFVVLSALFDFPNILAMSATLGRKATVTIANAAIAIIGAD